MFDARNREVYAGCWTFSDDGLEVVRPVEAGPLDGLIDALREVRPQLVGEGAWLHAEALRTAFGTDAVLPPDGPSIAAGLLWLAERMPASGLVADPASWEPDYVRAAGPDRIAAEGRTR